MARQPTQNEESARDEERHCVLLWFVFVELIANFIEYRHVHKSARGLKRLCEHSTRKTTKKTSNSATQIV